MAELARPAFATLPTPAGVTVTERRNLGLAHVALLRGGRDEAGRRLKEAFGLDLVAGPRCSLADGLRLVATGPATWLAVAEDPELPERLATLLEGCAAVVDQSHGYGVLRLSGPGVFELLAKGVAIDLDPAVFGPGGAAVTQVEHMGTILWQVDDAPSFDLAVFRSYAGSLAHFLAEAGGAL